MNKNKSSIYNNIMNKTTKNNNNKIEHEFIFIDKKSVKYKRSPIVSSI